MITVLTGENSFEISRALDEIITGFDGYPEKFDGGNLEFSQLSDLLLGGTFFASERLIVIRELSENNLLWDVLPGWLARVSEDTHLVLVEAKPDKRTKTYKYLKKFADVKEFNAWGERDSILAEKWVTEEFVKLSKPTPVQGQALQREVARMLVARVGMDQWQLYHAIQKLAVLDDVTPEIVGQIIEANPSENVFNLLDAALSGNTKKVSDMIKILERSQDPYMTFGLLSSQVFQLAALSVADKSPSEIASDIGAHPYALSKLTPYARTITKSDIKKIVRIFADTDTAMKSTGADPWLLTEHALVKTGVLV